MTVGVDLVSYVYKKGGWAFTYALRLLGIGWINLG